MGRYQPAKGSQSLHMDGFLGGARIRAHEWVERWAVVAAHAVMMGLEPFEGSKSAAGAFVIGHEHLLWCGSLREFHSRTSGAICSKAVPARIRGGVF